MLKLSLQLFVSTQCYSWGLHGEFNQETCSFLLVTSQMKSVSWFSWEDLQNTGENETNFVKKGPFFFFAISGRIKVLGNEIWLLNLRNSTNMTKPALSVVGSCLILTLWGLSGLKSHSIAVKCVLSLFRKQTLKQVFKYIQLTFCRNHRGKMIVSSITKLHLLKDLVEEWKNESVNLKLIILNFSQDGGWWKDSTKCGS